VNCPAGYIIKSSVADKIMLGAW